ncbi:MAG: helix-turn-helix domain-containing protein [Pseudonocardiaceae bacterium]
MSSTAPLAGSTAPLKVNPAPLKVSTTPLTLREGDRGRLEAMVRSVSVRPSLARRARIVLMSAEGLPNAEIARRTGSTRPTVINWRNRYATGGIKALGDLPRPGRPAVVDEFKVVATTLADGGHPPANLRVSHWSSRLLAQQLGISFATVARIWRKWDIQPEHVETFTASTERTRQVHPGVVETTEGSLSRQATSDTHADLDNGSSRLVKNRSSRNLDQSADRTPDSKSVSKSVRAEFHGTRGRRYGPTSRPHG